MAFRKASIKRRVEPALYRAMAPGEQIVAGVLGVTGPAPAAVDLAVRLTAVGALLRRAWHSDLERMITALRTANSISG